VPAAVRTTTAMVDGAVYRAERNASVNLCSSQPAWTTTTKRREKEQNLIVNLNLSLNQLNLKRNLRSTYCTIEATDRHEASRGLSETTMLLL